MSGFFGAGPVGRASSDSVAVSACAEVATAFCELLDAGDADAAFALHADDLAFYPPGGTVALDRDAARAAGERMLRAYPGRRTLHVLGNFLGRVTAPDRVHAQYVVTVYELTEVVDAETRDRDVPVIFAFAHEHAVFVRSTEGVWRYLEQRMIPIAPLNPFDRSAS